MPPPLPARSPTCAVPALLQAGPRRRRPAVTLRPNHFQGGAGSRFENAGAAAGAAVRFGEAGGRAEEGHGWALGWAAAAGVDPALLQPAAETADDGEGRKWGRGGGEGWRSQGHKGRGLGNGAVRMSTKGWGCRGVGTRS